MLRLYFLLTTLVATLLLITNLAITRWLGIHFHSITWLLGILILAYLSTAGRETLRGGSKLGMIVLTGVLVGCLTVPLGYLPFVIQGGNLSLGAALGFSAAAILLAFAVGLALAWLILRFLLRKREHSRRELLHCSLAAVMFPFSAQPWLILAAAIFLAIVNLPHEKPQPPRLERLTHDPQQVAAYRELIRYVVSDEHREALMKQARTDSLEDPTPGISHPAPAVGYLQQFLPEMRKAATAWNAQQKPDTAPQGVDLDPETVQAIDQFLDFLAENDPSNPAVSFETIFPDYELTQAVFRSELADITHDLRQGPEQAEEARRRLLRLTQVLATQWQSGESLVGLLVNVSLTGMVSVVWNNEELDLNRHETLQLLDNLRKIRENLRPTAAQAVRGELGGQDDLLESVKREPNALYLMGKGENTSVAAKRWLGSLGLIRLLAFFQYDKVQTRRQIEDYFVDFHRAATLPFAERQALLEEVFQRIEVEQNSVTDPQRLLLKDNVGGTILMGIAIPAYNTIFLRIDEAEALVLVKILALEAELAGELPEELPVDPTSETGQPFQVILDDTGDRRILTLAEDSFVREKENRDLDNYSVALPESARQEPD